MNITIEELEKLETGTFDVIDMRGETEIVHGAIPGSVAIPEQELLENPPENTGKKLIIVCSRGRVSVDVSAPFPQNLCCEASASWSVPGHRKASPLKWSQSHHHSDAPGRSYYTPVP